MTWFKVDDSFHSHPKALAAGPAALGLWVIAGSWCSANLKDGFVPDYALPRLAEGARELAETLVAAGLWRRAKGGYRFHDWTAYNPTRVEVLEERQRWAEKKTRQRAAKAGKPGKATSERKMSQGDTPEESRTGLPRESRPSRTRTSSLEEVDKDASHPSSSAVEDRADIDRVCLHLAARIETNGSKRPTITRRWRDAARLMIDRDGRTEEQVHAAIRWCQDDEFWRSNILSLPKLREKYDQLRLAATRGRPEARQPIRPTTADWTTGRTADSTIGLLTDSTTGLSTARAAPRFPPRSTTDERVARAQALKAELHKTPTFIAGELS